MIGVAIDTAVNEDSVQNYADGPLGARFSKIRAPQLVAGALFAPRPLPRHGGEWRRFVGGRHRAIIV
jgi:hypothetical protein